MATGVEAAGVAVDLFAEPATRWRYAAAAYAPDGSYNENGTKTSTAIYAAIQPMAGNSTAEGRMDLNMVPEGERVEDYVLIWTRADLRMSNEADGTVSDEVEAADGRRFRIVSAVTRYGFTRAIGGLVYDRGRSL